MRLRVLSSSFMFDFSDFCLFAAVPNSKCSSPSGTRRPLVRVCGDCYVWTLFMELNQ